MSFYVIADIWMIYIYHLCLSHYFKMLYVVEIAFCN